MTDSAPSLRTSRSMRAAADAGYRGAEVHGQLYRGRADRPGRPVDQDGLPASQARLVPQEAQRRGVGQRGRLRVAHIRRLRRHRTVLGQADVFGVGAEPGRDGAEHRLTHTEKADPGPGRRHVPGEVAAQHLESRPQQAEMGSGVPGRTAAGQAVHHPDRGRTDPDQDLVVARFGPGHVGDRNHVRRSERAADRGLHRDSPSGYWNTSSSGTLNTRAIWNATSREGE